jgi:hypothetical protein
MKALRITMDSRVEEIEINRLEDMQKAVDGWIELVPLSDNPGVTIYCNEEGKVRGLPVNRLATMFADNWRSWLDPLCGDVLVLGPIDRSGNDTDVMPEIVEAARSLETLWAHEVAR